MIGKFLIDECLSIGLTATAKARGHQADHVAHLGKRMAGLESGDIRIGETTTPSSPTTDQIFSSVTQMSTCMLD